MADLLSVGGDTISAYCIHKHGNSVDRDWMLHNAKSHNDAGKMVQLSSVDALQLVEHVLEHRIE